MATRWNWTAEDEYELCEAVWGMGDLLDWNKRHGHRSDVFWNQIAGRLWPEIKVTGDACRKRWEQSKAQFFADMKRQMEEEAEARKQAEEEKEKWTEALKPLDDKWTQAEALAARYEHLERDLAESTYDNTQDIRNTLSILLEDVRRLCQAWDVVTVAAESQSEELSLRGNT